MVENTANGIFAKHGTFKSNFYNRSFLREKKTTTFKHLKLKGWSNLHENMPGLNLLVSSENHVHIKNVIIIIFFKCDKKIKTFFNLHDSETHLFFNKRTKAHGRHLQKMKDSLNILNLNHKIFLPKYLEVKNLVKQESAVCQHKRSQTGGCTCWPLASPLSGWCSAPGYLCWGG